MWIVEWVWAPWLFSWWGCLVPEWHWVEAGGGSSCSGLGCDDNK